VSESHAVYREIKVLVNSLDDVDNSGHCAGRRGRAAGSDPANIYATGGETTGALRTACHRAGDHTGRIVSISANS